MENKLAASNTAFTPVETVAAAGYTFLTTTASAWRGVGYCLEVNYIGTELNRSGKLYTGTVPASLIPAGTATSVDSIKTLLSNDTRTPDRQLESKWFPGVTNEDYTNRGGSTYPNSNNVTLIVAENMPAGIQLAFKETVIYEWIPQPGLGFVAPTSLAGLNPPAFMENLHNVAKKDPSFTHSFSEHAGTELRRIAGAAGTYAVRAGAAGLMSLGKKAMRTAPLLLTM